MTVYDCIFMPKKTLDNQVPLFFDKCKSKMQFETGNRDCVRVLAYNSDFLRKAERESAYAQGTTYIGMYPA